MTRKEFEALVFEKYGTEADYPFEDDLETGVFRHVDSGKWFALAMRIKKKRLLPCGEELVDVVNLKCAPEVIDSLVGVEKGVYRAYHMNKTHWLTLLLCECEADTVSWLLSVSYELTCRKKKNNGSST